MSGSPWIRAAVVLIAVVVIAGAGTAGSMLLAQPAAASPAIVAGRVQLQQRTDYAGVVVQVGGQSTATGDDGRFSLADAPTGSQVARASAAGFLSAEGALTISPGQRLTLAEVTLLGGDVNGDGVIQLLDLVALGAAYGQCPPQDPRLDLNADRCLNILDLVILGANYGRAGPLPWAPLPEPTATPDPYPQPGATLTPEPYPGPDPTPTSAAITRSLTATPSLPAACIRAEEAWDHLGESRCVDMRVVSAYYGDAGLYLNSRDPWRGAFYVYIPKETCLRCWSGCENAHFEGRDVRVYGILQEHSDSPEIVLQGCADIIVQE